MGPIKRNDHGYQNLLNFNLVGRAPQLTAQRMTIAIDLQMNKKIFK